MLEIMFYILHMPLSLHMEFVKGRGLWCLMPLSAISWQSVLLVEETGVCRENHQPVEICDGKDKY